MRSRLLAFRRTAAIGAVWAVAMAALIATSSSAGGQEAVDPGRGQAYAQGIKIDPRSGRLSFGLTLGMALAGHQNNTAIGESRSLDLGLIGTTLAGEKCDGGDPTLPKEDQPQPLVVRSTDESTSRSENENTVEKRAEATDQPYAESVSVTAATGDAATVRIGATTSRTRSGIIDGKRQAIASTDVGDITIAGGALVIKGLRWRAVHQSAPEEHVEGSFTIDGIDALGESIPVDDVAAGLAELNALLAPLGVFIDAPEVRHESGILSIEPLRIGIEPSQQRDGLIGPVLNALQPVREEVFDALIEMDCSNAGYLTIADVVLGSVTGAGSMNLELGGVTATTDDIDRTALLGALGGNSPGTLSDVPPARPAGGSVSSGGISSGGGSTSTGSQSTTTSTPTTVETEPASADDETAAAAVQPVSGSRGGPLVGVGLGGLLLLAALAEGDRRKMRRAQRSVPMEVMA